MNAGESSLVWLAAPRQDTADGSAFSVKSEAMTDFEYEKIESFSSEEVQNSQVWIIGK